MAGNPRIGVFATKFPGVDAGDSPGQETASTGAAMKSPPWLARTHLDWAESLLARGETTRAAAQLDAAEVALGDLDLPASRTRLAALRSTG